MVKRLDIEFAAEPGLMLRGWLYVPDAASTEQRHSAITMAHGFAGVKEHGLEPFAEAFAEAGFVVLLHDHRNFGASDGQPRQDINPWLQIADWRRAISFLESRPEVDPQRIGLWGTSYSGGHALVLGANDRRLKCIVSQVPTISGHEQGVRRCWWAPGVEWWAARAGPTGHCVADPHRLPGQPWRHHEFLRRMQHQQGWRGGWTGLQAIGRNLSRLHLVGRRGLDRLE